MSEGERRRRHKDDEETREKLKRKLSQSNQSNDNQCTICLNDIRDLSFADCCLHPFCRSCIIEWSKRSNHCPVCRTTFDNILTNVKSDSDYEAIPIEPPPSMHIIPIERELIFLLDGGGTLIRTRIGNDEGFTEITESRGANGSTRTVTTTNREQETSVGRDANQPVTGPGPPNNPSTSEIEEIGRFMDVLFHSLLVPGPFPDTALNENQSTLDPRLGHPRSRLPGPFYPPPMLLPPLRRGRTPYIFANIERLPRNYQNLRSRRMFSNRRGRSGIYRYPVRSDPTNPSTTAPTRPASHNESTSNSEDNHQNSQTEEPRRRSKRLRKKSNNDEKPKD